MTQTLLTPSIIAKEALLVLENNMVMANLVHRAYSQEFAHVGSTVTVRKPATFEATAFSTTVAVQDIAESSVQVVLDTLLDVSMEVSAKELTLDIVAFSEQVLAPAMRAHAQAVDAKLTALYADIAGHTSVSGTPAISDLANMNAQLDIQKVPFADRRVVLYPTTHAKYIALDAVLHADKRGTPLTIKEAAIGRILGADYYLDQNIATHTSLVVDTAAEMEGTAAAGATACTFAAMTNGEVIAAGDIFKVTGLDRGYLIVTGGTVASTVCAVTFTPALEAEAADTVVVTFENTHRANLAFHKNAFALVTAPLEPPMGGAKAEVANYKGLSCRVVYDYTMSSKKNAISIDLLCGVKTLDKELAARLCD